MKKSDIYRKFAAFALFVFYLVPWITAVAREHERHGLILAANLLLGWTGVGWIGLLAYALMSEPRASEARRQRLLRVVPGGADARSEP